MRDLRFKVSGQTIEKETGCDFTGIASGTDNWLNLVFSFDASWAGMAKVVCMRDSNGAETNRVVNGKVAVPSSVTDGKFFSIQIYGKQACIMNSLKMIITERRVLLCSTI